MKLSAPAESGGWLRNDERRHVWAIAGKDSGWEALRGRDSFWGCRKSLGATECRQTQEPDLANTTIQQDKE
jgi:hypothetical protein